LEIKEDRLLPSLDEELFLDEAPKPIKLFDESLLIEPLEHATSSEKDTLEFLDCLLEEDEDDEDTEDLSDLTGTTTGDSEEQFSQLATLSLAIRGTLPSSLQKLSLASLL